MNEQCPDPFARPFRPTLLVTTLALALAFLLRNPGPAHCAEPAASEWPAGSLVIVGGGILPDAVRERFLELAGGKRARLVLIPTASERAEEGERMRNWVFWKSQDVASVALLHTRSRDRANEPAFVKPLTEATGVWLGGGDQSRLVSAYGGTLVEKELRKLLARGGVIGGTSAGAAVMSPVAIFGGNPSAKVGVGFGLLPGTVVDQHFMNRKRLDRLLGVLASHPDCLGIGIDEQTAAVVRGRELAVVGNAGVRICLAPADKEPASVQVLKAGDHADLAALSRAAAARLHPARRSDDGPRAEAPRTGAQ